MRFTFLKISILFIIGIISGRYCPLDFSQLLIFQLVLLPAAWYVTRRRRAGAILVFLLIMTGGWLHYDITEHRDKKTITGNVFKLELLENRRYGRYIARLEAYLEDSVWRVTNRKVLVYLPDHGLETDTPLLVEGAPHLLKQDGRWETFMTSYLRGSHILFSIHAVPLVQLPATRSPVRTIRFNLEHKIAEILPDKVSERLFAGILLGNKQGIPDQVMENFQRIGGMHVLAVSGLHVSVIYLFLRILLIPLPDYTVWRFLKFIILLTLLWVYAAVTGYSSSVCRAVMFFTLFSTAELSGRRVFLYHILPLTATFMWVYDPMDLWSIGFQLSFGAVLGIMVFQPRFEKMISGLSHLPLYLLRLLTVSVSAQAFTWPLVIYYFGGISMSGILFSVFLIPLVLVIIITGIVTLFMNQVPLAGEFLTKALRFLLAELRDFAAFASDHAWYLSEIPRGVIVSGPVIIVLILLFLHYHSKFILFNILGAAFILAVIPLIQVEEKKGLTISATSGISVSEDRQWSRGSGYKMELFKFGSNRIFITRTVVPEGIEAEVILIDGNVKPGPLTGMPIIVITDKVPYSTRQEWLSWSASMNLDFRELAAGPVKL